VGVADSIETVRRMCLYWGTRPFFYDGEKSPDLNVEDMIYKVLQTDDAVALGDRVVITFGEKNFFTSASSNSIRVEIIKKLPSQVHHELSEKKALRP
jgi:pyruvate kinase